MRVFLISMLVFLLLAVPRAHAQDWEVGAMGGAAGYMGDINPENPFLYNDWGVGLWGKYNLNSTWGVRGNFSYSKIRGDDLNSPVAHQRQRALNFSSHVAEASLLVDFHFFRFLPQRSRYSYTPYLFAGVGYIDFYPQWIEPGGVPGEWDAIRNNVDNGDSWSISVPFGAGFKYNLRGPWTVGVEVGYRLTFTDYLDAVSGSEPQQSERWLQGNGRPHDSFMTAGFTISYTIFKGGCPEWRN